MAIRVVRNDAGNCVNFYGTNHPAYFNACLSAEVDSQEPERINIINDIKSNVLGETFYEFYNIHYSEFLDADGSGFSNAPEAAAYITEKAHVIGNDGPTQLRTTQPVDFTRDYTDTTVLFSNGDDHAVNSIRAFDAGDGTITITEHGTSGVNLYEGLNHDEVTINGGTAGNNLATVVNALNALFTVNPLGGGTVPVVTMPTTDASAAAYETNGLIDPVGDPIGSDDTGVAGYGRLWTTETINAPGEYFLIKMTSRGRFTLGLYESGVDTDLSAMNTNAHSDQLYSQAFYNYGSYLGPWTLYGRRATFSYGPGWLGSNDTMFRYNTTVQDAIENGLPVLYKVGISTDGYAEVSYYDDGRSNDFIRISRSSYLLEEGDYGLMVKMHDAHAKIYADPSGVGLETADTAVPLAYRYIESPDGSFHYPLFATQLEASTVDVDLGGSGGFDSLVYVDEPTMATWYMPETGSTVDGSAAPPTGGSITYTEIPTNDDALYAPSLLTFNDLTYDENQVVNAQILPQDLLATVTGLPAGLSMVGGFIQGTTQYVSETTSYTVTVERSNNYGTTTQTFDITINHNSSLSDLTGWEEYGSNAIITQPDLIHHYGGFANLKFDQTLDPGTEFEWVQENANGVGGPGQYAQFGIVSSGVDLSSGQLANTSVGWDLKATIWTGTLNHSLGVTGWNDNSQISTGNNHGVTWKLSFPTDGGPIELYRDGTLMLSSTENFTGNQEIVFATPVAYTTSVRLPAISKVTIGAGSTTPPAGFVSPLTEGVMANSTDLSGDAVATLSATLDVGRRYIVPQAWIEANVLPKLDGAYNKAYVGVPKTAANWSNGVDLHNDFDAVMRWEWLSGGRHKSSASVGDSINANPKTINSDTDAFYDYAIEWDGTDLHLIRCNINSINTEPGVAQGGSFTDVYTYSNYSDRTGSLPLVMATKTGGSMTLTTVGLQDIRIPFGQRDVLVGESSSGNGQFALQPTAASFDDPGQHASSNLSFGGVSALDAGYTYRFVYDPSLEAGDYIEFRLASDGTTVYSTGVSAFDGTSDGDPKAGEKYKGVTFAVPTDAPPLQLWYYNSFASSFDNGAARPITIAGSTYVTPVTGVAIEGPSSNFTGNVITSGTNGWISLNETLAAGERLVLDSAFLQDVKAALPDYCIFWVGVKDTLWSDTSTPTSAFEGLAALRFYNTSVNNTGAYGAETGIRIMGYANNGTTSQNYVSPTVLANSSAFIEITNSGNNIRVGYDIDGTDSVSGTSYAEWSTDRKVQTGDQGYGITSRDVVIYWQALPGNDTGFDISDVDWTGLTEVSIPAAPTTITTNWNKALDFGGSSERTQQVDAGNNFAALKMGGLGVTTSAPSTAGNTSNDSNARPWATAIVFNADGHSSNQHIWNMGEGSGSTDDNIYLRLSASRQLFFGWGRDGSLNELYIGTITAGRWYGIYVGHNGTRLSGNNANSSNLSAAFDVKLMSSADSFVSMSDQGSTAEWGNTGYSTLGGRMDRTFTGGMFVGGRGANRSFHGKVASMVVTTLRRNQAMPDDNEIKMMIRDPKQWLTDYKVGQSYRAPNSSSNLSNFQLNSSTPAYGTQVWLMGDGTYDGYAQIRNQVYPSIQNVYPLNMVSMVSNDIQNVTIPGLS